MPLEIKELIVKGTVESDNKKATSTLLNLLTKNYLKKNHKIILIGKV